MASLPSRGAWVEIAIFRRRAFCAFRRSPRGERGLKYGTITHNRARGSRSPRGERGLKWVQPDSSPNRAKRRSPRGERGLKSERNMQRSASSRRSPRGERGLKCAGVDDTLALGGSLPSRGAWVEIRMADTSCDGGRSLPSRGAWVEIPAWWQKNPALESLPSRGAWVEMAMAEKTRGIRRCRSPRGERGLK